MMIARWFRSKKPAVVPKSMETEEERGRRDAMHAERMAIQRELGISHYDDTQAWLRLHQLLKSHEDRIRALEAQATKPRSRRAVQ